MATGTLPKPDQDEHNVGQRRSDDLFSHLEKELANPTGSSVGEDAAIDRAKAAARDNQSPTNPIAAAENGAIPPKTGTDLAQAEDNSKLPSAQEMYKRAAEGKKVSGRRGVFIGLGAGGGLLSVIAGFSFMLPFKLPGIMDSITNRTAARLENVIEKRGEKFLLQYLIRGSSAAVGGPDFIVTGNPIGDIFANIRTSNFEKNLKESYGLTIERGKNGAVRISHDGTSLGDFKNADQLEKYLNRDDLSVKEIRKVFKLITTDKFGVVRIYKRVKFVKWLRLKYKIPRFGFRKQQQGETDQKYTEATVDDMNQKVETGNLNNLGNFVDCLSSGGDDCNGPDQKKLADLDKGGGASDLKKLTTEAISEVSEEASKEGAKVGKKFTQRVLERIIGKLGASLVPFVGEIDLGARLDHFMALGLEDHLLQKLHGDYMRAAYIIMYATVVSYADQTKAGDMISQASGTIAGRFDGMQTSQSYNMIESGEMKGTGLTTMQKIGEDTNYSEWQKLPGQVYGTIGLVPRAPLILWYYTVSQVFDFVGGAFSSITDRIPGVAIALQAFSKLISALLGGLLDLVGMSVDPLDVGEKLHLDNFVGATAAYDDHAKDFGMRKLTHDQALAVDNSIKQEHLADRADQPWYDRLFNPNNSDSLASNLIIGLPSPGTQSPLGDIAFAGADMLNRAPTELASLTTPSAYAANIAIPEDIGGLNAFGGTIQDLSQTFSHDVLSNNPCPDTADGSTFNTCAVDKAVSETVGCAFVLCDGYTVTDNQGSPNTLSNNVDDNLFVTYQDQDHSTADQTASTPVTPQLASEITQTGGMLAQLLPVAALEISSRRKTNA
jgi:hypothetical protein